VDAFAKRLRELRTERGMSQEALAAAAGASKATIQNWEAQRRSPSLRDACKVADALGVSLDDLAGRPAATAPAEGERRFGPMELAQLAHDVADRAGRPPDADEPATGTPQPGQG
jgi:transcriptional regulator with XRE-family HTH domain